MVITTKYDLEDRVAWFYRDTVYAEVLTGVVKEIETATDEDGTEILYTLKCDKEIKSSDKHFLKQSSVFPESYKGYMEQAQKEAKKENELQ